MKWAKPGVRLSSAFIILSEGVHHLDIVRADGTYAWWLDHQNAGLKPCATTSPVPIALTCGNHKNIHPKAQCHWHGRSCSTGIYPGESRCIYKHKCRRHGRYNRSAYGCEPGVKTMHDKIDRADCTYAWWLDHHYAGLKPCATTSPVPTALTCGRHKTSIPKPNAIGMSDVVAPVFIPVGHGRCCCPGIYPNAAGRYCNAIIYPNRQ